MKHVFHLRSNTFIFIVKRVSFEKTCQKKGVRALSRVPNTYGLVISSVFRCLEPVIKHLPSFFGILHQTQVCHTLLHGLLPLKLLVSHYCWGVGVTSNSLVKLCGIRRFTSRCFLFFTAAHNLSKTATTQLNH